MDWRERLIEESSVTCERLARSWDTCAVSEQIAKHPNVVLTINPWTHDPQDYILHGLGLAFWESLRDGDRDRATEILDQIEDRVLELKRGT